MPWMISGHSPGLGRQHGQRENVRRCSAAWPLVRLRCHWQEGVVEELERPPAFRGIRCGGLPLESWQAHAWHLPGLGNQGERALCQALAGALVGIRRPMKALEVVKVFICRWNTPWQVELASGILERIARQVDLLCLFFDFWRSQWRRRWIPAALYPVAFELYGLRRSSDRRQEQTSAARIQHSTTKPIGVHSLQNKRVQGGPA